MLPTTYAMHLQMVAGMVSEIILAVKERNKQTRATAFELLVQVRWAPRLLVWRSLICDSSLPSLLALLFAATLSRAGGWQHVPQLLTHVPRPLLQIAHAMHEAEPPPPGMGLGGFDAAMAEDGEALRRICVVGLELARHRACAHHADLARLPFD